MVLPAATQHQNFSLLPKIINGGIAGIIGVSCVFPLDLVKTRLQNQQVGSRGERMYNSMLDCFRKTYKAEGYFGMYRGSCVTILLITPEKSIKLASNDFFRYHLTTKDGRLPVFRQMLAGGSAGLCACVITTPMDLLKIQLQDAGRIAMSGRSPATSRLSASSIALGLLKTRGITGLYKGISATVLREVGFTMAYFPLFAALNRLGPRKAENPGDAVFYWSFLSGMAAASISSLSTNPFDVMKTRLQLLKKGVGEQTYKGVPDAFATILKQEGPKAFLKGAVTRVMVLAPLFGITQMVYLLGVGEFLLGIQK